MYVYVCGGGGKKKRDKIPLPLAHTVPMWKTDAALIVIDYALFFCFLLFRGVFVLAILSRGKFNIDATKKPSSNGKRKMLLIHSNGRALR